MPKFNNNRPIKKPDDVLVEFEGYEIETKLQVLDFKKKKLLNLIISTLEEKGRFSTLPNYTNLEWIFYFDYYIDKKTNKKIFDLVHHPSTNKFWLRNKLPHKNYHIGDYRILQSIENTEEYKQILTEEKLLEILSKKRRETGTKPILLGRIVREKYYNYILHPSSGKVFSISLDKNKALNSEIWQLEVEYKWTIKKPSGSLNKISPILDVYRETLDILTKRFPILIPTTLTKYEWLLAVSRLNENS